MPLIGPEVIRPSAHAQVELRRGADDPDRWDPGPAGNVDATRVGSRVPGREQRRRAPGVAALAVDPEAARGARDRGSPGRRRPPERCSRIPGHRRRVLLRVIDDSQALRAGPLPPGAERVTRRDRIAGSRRRPRTATPRSGALEVGHDHPEPAAVESAAVSAGRCTRRRREARMPANQARPAARAHRERARSRAAGCAHRHTVVGPDPPPLPLRGDRVGLPSRRSVRVGTRTTRLLAWPVPCGRGSVGRASPCQGEGRGFESRRPLGGSYKVRHPAYTVEWPRGEAAACKAVYTGSNPVSTSIHCTQHARAIGAAVARFLDTEEVTGSIPVSPTTYHRRSEAPRSSDSGASASFSGTVGSEKAARAPRTRSRWSPMTCV